MAKNDTSQRNLLKLGSAIGFNTAEEILITFIRNAVEKELESYKKYNLENQSSKNNVTPLLIKVK